MTHCVFILPGQLLIAALPQADHVHGSHPGRVDEVERPKVFLDKSPRIVEYQLRRLDNTRLLLVERHPCKPIYRPIYQAILLRPGMARQHRDEALPGLTTLNCTTAVTELLQAIQSLDARDREQLQLLAGKPNR